MYKQDISSTSSTTKESVDAFERDGFVVLDQVISQKDVDHVFEQIDVVLTEALKKAGLQPNDYDNVDKKYYALKNHDPKLKSRTYDLLQHLDSLMVLSCRDEILGTIRRITQSPLLMDFVSLRIDDSDNDRLQPFHQEAFAQISYECITAWVPLVNITEKSGGLKVVPGSHKLGFVKHQFYGNYHGVFGEYLENVQEVRVKPSLGDVVIFHPCLFHASTPMTGESPIRWTMVTRYNSLRQIPYWSEEGAPFRIEKK